MKKTQNKSLNGSTKEKIDLVELSGGSYESAAMAGELTDGEFSSTTAREMYFIDFAKEIRKIAKMPIMVTGGVTKFENGRTGPRRRRRRYCWDCQSYGLCTDSSQSMARGRKI